MNTSAQEVRVKPQLLELVYCPMCTHTVEAVVIPKGKRMVVGKGQRCSHCHAALDAGFVLPHERAA